MDDKVIFEDCNVIFTDEDFKNVDVDTLEECKEKLVKLMSKLNS